MLISPTGTGPIKWNPPAAPPAPAPGDVEFSYNAQDVMVMPSIATVIHNVHGTATDRVKLQADLAPDNGRFVFKDDDPRSTAAVSFAAAAKTVEMMEKALGQPLHWAFDGAQLGVIPDQGKDFNAYYARESGALHFFHGTDPVTGATVMSGASGEVASHETGHAILDALRPNYLMSWTPDAGAFHESFGDQVAMLMALHDERSINRAVVQCGGDLTKPNCIAALGEQIGTAMNDSAGANKTGGDYTRNAINSFTWVDPAKLPAKAPSSQLSSEVHSFSRLWTGAFYDVLTAINAQNMQKGMSPHDALKATGEEGLKLLTNLLKSAPQGDFTYRDMAQAFVQSDQQSNGGARADLIRDVFTKCLILPQAEAASTPAPELPKAPFMSLEPAAARTVDLRLHGSQFGMFDGAHVQTVVDGDGSLAKDAEVGERTRANVARLIDAGRIRYTDPNQPLKFPQDAFDPQGEPYVGYVRWENGEMHLERVKVTD